MKATDISVSEDERKGTLFELKGICYLYLAEWLSMKKET